MVVNMNSVMKIHGEAEIEVMHHREEALEVHRILERRRLIDDEMKEMETTAMMAMGDTEEEETVEHGDNRGVKLG